MTINNNINNKNKDEPNETIIRKCGICEATGIGGKPIPCECGEKLSYFEKLILVKISDVGYYLKEIDARLEEIRNR